MSKQFIHFITYGDKVFEDSRKRIVEEAQNTRWFDTITAYTPDSLSENFKHEYPEVLSQKRGGGYWIWKFDIIRQKLDEIPFGDIVVYLDSGCTINPKGEKRFQEYVQMLNDNDKCIISFELTHLEKTYTTKQLLQYFDLCGDTTYQYMATVLLMKKTLHVQDIFNTCFDVIRTDWRLITDYYNNIEQMKEFKDSRHDQSILSLVRKKKGSIVLSDETWANNFTKINHCPFWATRKK